MVQSFSLQQRISTVLIGGFLGTISRYLLSQWLQSLLGKDLPYDILLINLTGALVLAFVTVLADKALVGPMQRLFINVGFLGAYTTFSSMALGCVLLLEAGKWMSGLLYLFFSFDGGVLAVWVGNWLGQQFCTYVKIRPPKIAPSTSTQYPVRWERGDPKPAQEPLVKAFKPQFAQAGAIRETIQPVLRLPSKQYLTSDISKGNLGAVPTPAIPRSKEPDRTSSHASLRPKRQFIPPQGQQIGA